MSVKLCVLLAMLIVSLTAALSRAGTGLAAPDDTLPDPGALVRIMSIFTDPNIPGAQKAGSVEGGLPEPAMHALDAVMRRATRHHEFPLSYSAANITPMGPGRISADITVYGPKLPTPVTRPVDFTNVDGRWLLGQDSAIELIADATY